MSILYEWLLEQAKGLGIRGGSSFSAIAGCGRQVIPHELHFFELAGDLCVVTEFIVTGDEADALISRGTDRGAFFQHESVPFAEPAPARTAQLFGQMRGAIVRGAGGDMDFPFVSAVAGLLP
jgi:hypothetical protein